jgi:hypothetical protein
MFSFLKKRKDIKNIKTKEEALHTIRELKEKFNLDDSNSLLQDLSNLDKKPLSFLKGRVVWVDDQSGEVVFDKSNIIVLRGRTFALEKMFDTQLSASLNGNNLSDEDKNKLTPNISADYLNDNYTCYGYNQNDLSTKKICLFKVGNGGCVTGNPFNVIPIQYPDARILAHEIPFRFTSETGDVSDTGVSYDVNDSNYKYADIKEYTVTKLIDNTTAEEVGETRNAYFAKRISGISWIDNPNTHDEIAVKLTLEISDDDFRTTYNADTGAYKRHTMVNELGLCIANDYSSSEGTDNETLMLNRVVPSSVLQTLIDTDENYKQAIQSLYDEGRLVIYYKDIVELDNTYTGILDSIGGFSMGLTNDIDDDTIELATAIHFESEPYYNELKSSHIYYYIYA